MDGSAGYGVWIDYNQNNIFDASEKVSGSTGTGFLNMGPTTSITQSITIPTSALTGTTRMRVRIVEDDNYTGTNGAAILPCNASTSAADVMDWGETEDYTINITSATGITELTEVENLIIYPNPVTIILTLNQNLSGNLTYKILNLTGQEIQTGALNNSEKQITVTSLSEGIYFLQLYNSYQPLGQQRFIKINE